jgi:hypothetical protein
MHRPVGALFLGVILVVSIRISGLDRRFIGAVDAGEVLELAGRAFL